jgi:UDP-N-acetylmuramoyl-L-alanyl-D-glutamate--2,6-diaminopimelate ligase
MAQAMQEKGKQEGKDYFVMPDRGGAIQLGVKMARAGDIVIACGKGHEQSMCFGTTEYAWDELTAMKAAVAQMLEIDGPEMPYLPTQD